MNTKIPNKTIRRGPTRPCTASISVVPRNRFATAFRSGFRRRLNKEPSTNTNGIEIRAMHHSQSSRERSLAFSHPGRRRSISGPLAMFS